jgi:hypothetical protein
MGEKRSQVDGYTHMCLESIEHNTKNMKQKCGRENRECKVPRSKGGGGESGHGIEAFTEDFKNFVNSSKINNILDMTSDEQFLLRSKFLREMR